MKADHLRPTVGISPGLCRARRFLLQRGWPVFGAAARLHRTTLSRAKPLVVVVGSFGKTTTTAALDAALGLPGARFGNGFAGPAWSLLASPPNREPLVLEVGIGRKGQMIRHARTLRPDVVVVTAIGGEHRRSLGSLDETRDEKALILEGLRDGGTAVLNTDDPRVREMASRVPRRVVTYGFGEDADVRIRRHRLDWPHGSLLEIELFGEPLEMRTRLLGRVAVYAIPAALAVAELLGRDREEALRGLADLAPRPGRLCAMPLPRGAWLLGDEFKGTLETIEAALDLLEEIPARRLVAIGEIHEPPGSAGPHYRALGARLARIADRVVTIGSRKSAASMRSGARRAGLATGGFVHAGREWRKAHAILTDLLRPGDVLLVKGREPQRLMRLSLALSGRPVRCDLVECRQPVPGCHLCSRL